MTKSTLKASSADTWVNCTGSVKLALQFPAIESGEGVSEALLEGRAFHEVSERILNAYKSPGGELVSSGNIVGTLSRDNIVITDEMYDAALEYTNDVLRVANVNGTMREIHVEERVDLSSVYAGMYGYADCWLLDATANTLYIWDAKYGHRAVDAFENWQLIAYAAGLTERVNGAMDRDLNVSLRVSQPRSFRSGGTTQVWDCKASDLRGYINTLKSAAAEAYSDAATCKVGRQCDYCPARYACPALQQAAYGGADYVSAAEGVSLSGHHLALELRILKSAERAIKARLSGIEEQALAEIRSGKMLPGFIGEQGYGRKRWRKDTPHDEVIMMGDLLGIDLRKPVELDTPTQAIKKGIDASVIEAYSETPTTGLKLVEDTGAKARNVFRKLV
ncbi:MAG: DUF2800 domain-containing protein [Shewanella sp.]